MDSNQSEIVNFLTGKSIFITGASGFIGKALVYKLLTVCPKIGDIYILLREKRGFSCKERLNQILANKCFHGIRSNDSDLLDKVKPISGDISLDELGIEEGQRQLLIDNVSIVIHSAATVKFNAPLKESVNINLLGTRRMIQLAQCLKNLKAFVHLSTCYSNCNLSTTIENKIYTQNIDPDDLVQCCKWMTDDMISDVLPKLLDKRPNTYTLTKALTETLIERESDGLPIAIIRPSIVTSAYREPYPGWIDNVNNVPGISEVISLGLTRAMVGGEDEKIDLIPVDMLVNMIISTVWKVATDCDENDNQVTQVRRSPIVLNCSSGQVNPLALNQFKDYLLSAIVAYPNPKAIRGPSFNLVQKKWLKNTIQLVDQYLPCATLDLIASITGQKPKLVKSCDKINSMIDSFEFFTSHGWTFDSSEMIELFNSLNPIDQKLFHFNVASIDWPDYNKAIIVGLRQFTLQEGTKYNLQEARSSIQRKINLERGIKLIFTLIVGSFVYKTSF